MILADYISDGVMAPFNICYTIANLIFFLFFAGMAFMVIMGMIKWLTGWPPDPPKKKPDDYQI